jgi:threonine aldolase
MSIIDLRSDTVTKPSKAMLEAMFSSPVGDDVFAEDPTVIELERYAANLFGKESALFCPSGTMTNQIAIKVHTQPGDEVLCDVNSHIYNYEGGGISFNSGVQAKLLNGNEGRLSVELIEANINGDYDWLTRTSLVSLENTVNRAGGSYYTAAQIKPISEFCKNKKLKLHLDGARLFNGLGAPVGSLLLGDKAFIKQARRVRKVFGGGMRQAGLLAGAGLYALKNNVNRLKDDHHKAKKIEEVLKTKQFVESINPVYTNILIFHLKKDLITGDDFEKKLAQQNIKVSAFGKQTLRMVTHLDFTEDMLERTIQVLKTL